MNGHELSDLPIAVDSFRRSPHIQLYFLTHAHADHYVGLSKFWEEKIYCTATTGQIINFRVQVQKQYLVPLEELQPHVFKLRSLDETIYMTVTVIPANHCPGSCMFLFETDHIRILYTGDFRPNAQIYEIGKTLWGPSHRAIDLLYLDNTYAEPKCVFPSREEALEEIIEICRFHQDCTIFIGISYTGHEDLLEKLALELKEYIVVTPVHLDLLKLLGMKNVFSTDEGCSNIHLKPSHSVNYKHLCKVNETESCIGIQPTGKRCHTQRGVIKEGLLYTVPFSNHSNFKELWEFVKSVSPRRIIPIVPGRSKASGMESQFRADMTQFSCLLSNDSTRQFSIPRFPYCFSRAKHCESDSDKLGDKRRRKRNAKPILSHKKKFKTTASKPCGVIFDGDETT